MKKQPGRIVMEGMGGLLCPPTHPMYTQSVETDLGRRPDNRTRMSLECALTDQTLDGATVACVRTVLNTWERNKPALDSPEAREWILHVLGYFAGCYNFTGGELGWNADLLTIDSDKDPLANADYHAGVHLIRRYYPEYQPTAADFAGAYWGKKPCEQP